VAVVEVLLHPPGFVQLDVQQAADERAHPLVHLDEQVAMVRIKGVVEVEQPGIDVAEIGRLGVSHGPVYPRLTPPG